MVRREGLVPLAKRRSWALRADAQEDLLGKGAGQESEQVPWQSEVRNAAQLGTTQTGLGEWDGEPTVSVIGASTTGPSNPGHGYHAHAVLWDKPLPLPTIQDLYRP